MKEFKITFTNLAKAFAAKVGGVAAVEEKVRGEINEIITDNELDPTDIMLHTVFMNPTDGSDTLNFLCVPSSLEENTIVVDTATYEDMDEKLTNGPFKGATISIPVGDSE